MVTGNWFNSDDAVKIFNLGIDELWSRQLFKEGVKDTLSKRFMAQVGRCPKCGAETDVKGKFCSECGASIVTG